MGDVVPFPVKFSKEPSYAELEIALGQQVVVKMGVWFDPEEVPPEEPEGGAA